MLTLSQLSVTVGTPPQECRTVVEDITFQVPTGAVCALLGMNGSGKSSLLNACMGHPWYTITQGALQWHKEDLTSLPVTERARLGMFLISQHPLEIPGLSVETLLAESYRAVYTTLPAGEQWQELLRGACKQVGLTEDALTRQVGVEFSGGQKKRLELLQLLVLRPKLVLLDELDSGLDYEGVALLGTALQQYHQQYPTTTWVITSHHHQLFTYLRPTMVVRMIQGRAHGEEITHASF